SAQRAMAGAGPNNGIKVVQYHGVVRAADGRWKGYVTNKFDMRYEVGSHGTPEEAALAHDRAVLAILGPLATSTTLNFCAAFSHTELRFLKGPHAPSQCVAGVISMVMRGAVFDAALEQFAMRAYDAHTDPELALDVATFRLGNRDDALEVVGCDKERVAFVEAAKNKVHDAAWMRSYLQRRRLVGMTFEDEIRWPPMVPPPVVDVGDGFTGNELVYLPYGSCHVDEMIIG
uniref:AP2/ERF domain-containing protein n=1 Tax=Oryza brachyantha TaxID=4533 RepID=J3N2I5_ORYBR